MACGCRGGGTRGSVTARGKKVLGYEVTYPDGTVDPTLYGTPLEAQMARRRKGGGTTRQVTDPA